MCPDLGTLLHTQFAMSYVIFFPFIQLHPHHPTSANDQTMKKPQMTITMRNSRRWTDDTEEPIVLFGQLLGFLKPVLVNLFCK